MRLFRCDNVGAYGKTELLCHQFGVTMELTAPYTPQQNAVVERQFATDLSRSQSMMEAADLTEGLRNLLRKEAIMTATTMANISCTGITYKLSPYKKFYGKSPILKMELVQFGRLGSDNYRRKIKSDLAPKAIKCLFVGYTFNHNAHTYCIPDSLP
jgi:transposase InsO family protein